MPFKAGALEPLVLYTSLYKALAEGIAERLEAAVVAPVFQERTAHRVLGWPEVYIIVFAGEETDGAEEEVFGKLCAEQAPNDPVISVFQPDALEVLYRHAVFDEFFGKRVAEDANVAILFPVSPEAVRYIMPGLWEVIGNLRVARLGAVGG